MRCYGNVRGRVHRERVQEAWAPPAPPTPRGRGPRPVEVGGERFESTASAAASLGVCPWVVRRAALRLGDVRGLPVRFAEDA